MFFGSWRRRKSAALRRGTIRQTCLTQNLRRFIITIGRRILSRNQRLRIRQEYSRCRELVANRAIRRQVMPKLNEINTSSMAEKAVLFHEITNKVYEFIKKRKAPGKDFKYLYAENSNQPTLYSSAYACMTLSLLGRLTDLTAGQKSRWIEYFNSYQSDADGLFYDPVVDSALFRTANWWGTRHLALHMIIAYTDLGGRPVTSQ